MKLLDAAKHRSHIKFLEEGANLPGNNAHAKLKPYDDHCNKYHQGKSCAAASEALKSKKR